MALRIVKNSTAGDAKERDLAQEAKTIFEEYSLSRALATLWAPISAYIEMLEGDTDSAVRTLLASCETLEALGQAAELSSQAALLGDALHAQGRPAEAESWVDRAESCAAATDVHAQISWRPVRAKLLARHGSLDQAESLARGALSLADTTDALNLRAKVLLDLADVLRLGGKEDEAVRCVTDALALYEGKGNTVAADRIRARLADLAVA